MKRKLLIILLGGIVFVLLTYCVANWVTGAALAKTLAEMEAEGLPMTVDDIVPPALREADNAGPLLTQAFLGLSGDSAEYDFPPEVREILEQPIFSDEEFAFDLEEDLQATNGMVVLDLHTFFSP